MVENEAWNGKTKRLKKPKKLGARVRPENCWVEWLPVYKKPDGAAQPYNAYILISMWDGSFIAATCPCSNADEELLEQHVGHVRVVSIAPNVLGHALDSLLLSRQFKTLTARIVNGAKKVLDGDQERIRLNEDAEAALEEIAQLTKRLPTAIIHDDPMDAIPGLYGRNEEGLHMLEGRVLTFDWLEEAFRLYHECWFEDLAWHCAPGLHERMWDMAEENEKRLKGE